MSSSSEEELDELLRRQVMHQPRNFEERHRKSKEFRENFRLPVDAFVHRLELIVPRLEHRTRRNSPLTARQQLLVSLDHVYYRWPRSIYRPLCRPLYRSTVDRLSGASRSTVGRLSVESRPTVDRYSAR